MKENIFGRLSLIFGFASMEKTQFFCITGTCKYTQASEFIKLKFQLVNPYNLLVVHIISNS